MTHRAVLKESNGIVFRCILLDFKLAFSLVDCPTKAIELSPFYYFTRSKKRGSGVGFIPFQRILLWSEQSISTGI